MREVMVIRCWVLYALQPAHGIATRFVGILGAQPCGDGELAVRVSWVPLVDRGEWGPRLHNRTRLEVKQLQFWLEAINGVNLDAYEITAPEGRDLRTCVEILVEELLVAGAGDV